MFSAAVHAQPWPSKPVRVIVNVAPGGVADITARLLGAKLTETLGQPFIVENRAGGDGYIGFEAVARSDPDGSMLVYSPGSSMMIAPHIVNRPDLDPTKALVPIVPTGAVSLYVVTNPDEFQTLADFVNIRRGGMVAGILGDRYLFTGWERSRAFREWRLLAALMELGLPVPRPLAASCERAGLWYRAGLLTALIPDTETLADRIESGTLKRENWRAVGTTIRRFHASLPRPAGNMP